MRFACLSRSVPEVAGVRLLSSRIDWSRYPRDAWTNVPPRVEHDWFGRGLLKHPDHPLARAKSRILSELQIEAFEDLEPIVPVEDNFDALLIPADHVSRSPSDTYYVNEGHVLRTHMTAHQNQLLREGPTSWVAVGDVFRRDAVDATHFPVFHQMDGARIFPAGTSAHEAEKDLKHELEGLCRGLFGSEVQTRWRDDYFPFTEPSWELDVWFEGEWMEMLGSGLIHGDIMKRHHLQDRVGWAFGLGLERLAMVLYGVHDIRTFWSHDERFHRQFRGLPLDAPIRFEPYSKYPKSSRDVSFWIPEDFHEHAFFELVREVAGEMAETVELVDDFTHPKTGRQSRAFRIDYRSMDRTLESAEVNQLQDRIRSLAESSLKVELR